jgi:hypothetical protein
MRTDELKRRLAALEAEGLRVGDSPLRADRLADQVEKLAAELEHSELPEETRARAAGHLADAVRVLRRDDDGREAARRLGAAGTLLGPTPRKPSPFLDDD